MMETPGADGRKLLKLFGVAVTNFESESQELLNRINALGPDGGGDLVAPLRDLIELLADTNRRWQEVTQHLFSAQHRVLAGIVGALRSPESRG